MRRIRPIRLFTALILCAAALLSLASGALADEESGSVDELESQYVYTDPWADGYFIVTLDPGHGGKTTGGGASWYHALADGFDIHKCGEIGTIAAGRVVEVIGTKLSEENWDEIRRICALYRGFMMKYTI